MPLMRTLPLLLLFFTAGCASAGQRPATFGAADQVPVRFQRVSWASVQMQLPAPAHMAVLEVTPGARTAVKWVEGAPSGMLPAGRQVVEMQTAAPNSRGRLRAGPAPCNRPGERLFYDYSVARTVASADGIRETSFRGARVFCVRPNLISDEPVHDRRHLLIVVSPRQMDPQVLDQVLALFNQTYGGSPDGPDTLVSILGQTLAAQVPGSAAYYVRVPRA
jgi:hypothetical protein